MRIKNSEIEFLIMQNSEILESLGYELFNAKITYFVFSKRKYINFYKKLNKQLGRKIFVDPQTHLGSVFPFNNNTEHLILLNKNNIKNYDDLSSTIIHELLHVWQYIKYGVKYLSDNIDICEDEAYGIEKHAFKKGVKI